MLELKKELNIEQKRLFHRWLKKAIRQKDKDLFESIVETVGKEWHVFRNVKSGDFPKFANNLWKHIGDIKKGSYLWCDSQYQAYSYESKICFLINPSGYKLIYDDNIKTILMAEKKLKKFTDLSIDKKNWQEVVMAYYKNCVKSKPLKTEDFFKIDCNLWAKAV